jgi:glutamate-1-semialdehyde 2,1-aminomutase
MGALGGRADIIDLLDTGVSGAIHHGGSFNGNPVACAAGLATMHDLTAARIARMDDQAQDIAAGLRLAASELGIELTLSIQGSVVGIYFRSSLPASADDAVGRDAADLFRLACLNRGVYLASDSKLSLNTCITDSDLDEVVTALSDALLDYKREAVGSAV